VKTLPSIYPIKHSPQASQGPPPGGKLKSTFDIVKVWWNSAQRVSLAKTPALFVTLDARKAC